MSIVGFIPPAHPNFLAIGLLIYFPITRMLLPLHNYFIIVLLFEP